MDGSAKPSILYLLVDPKPNNDNAVLGLMSELAIELETLDGTIALLDPEEEFELLESESEMITGYAFSERLEFLSSRLAQAKELLQDSGIANPDRLAYTVETANVCIETSDIVADHFKPTCNFADPELEAIVREALSIQEGPIYQDIAATLTQLYAYNRGISSIEGIECLANLRNLQVGGNQIVDISPLSSLVNLTLLSIWQNQLTDIGKLADLTNLEYLYLTSNQISDIGPLSNLTKLVDLQFSENQVSDITALTNLTNLRNLEAGLNQISDIGPLAGLTNLSHRLDLFNNLIIDVSPLAGLTNLTQLYLYNNQINDISPLLGCSSLDFLAINDNPLLDPGTEDVITELEARGVIIWR
jgi:Leucine-rich repeat (LRR) protein